MSVPKQLVKHLAAAGTDALPAARDRLVLPFERRQRTRQRVQLESGTEAALMLPRGTVLRGGDRVLSVDGLAVEVVASPEEVSTVRAEDARELARAAYHLGNRHVPVEVGAACLRYLRDHVLDAMVRGLGLEVIHELAPFEPEVGAYAHGEGHAHGGHTHGHAHDHSHGDAHAHPRFHHHASVPFRR